MLAAAKTFSKHFRRPRDQHYVRADSQLQGEQTEGRFSDQSLALIDEDEQLRLALAISAAEARGDTWVATSNSSAPQLPSFPSLRPRSADWAPVFPPDDGTAGDELLARQLQEQLDLEQGPGSSPTGRATSSHSPARGAPSIPTPTEPSRDKDSGTTYQPLTAPLGSPSGLDGHLVTPPKGVPAGPAPRHPPSTALSAGLSRAPPTLNACGGCGKAVRPWHGTYAVADGRKWHTWCLQCAHCKQPIQVRGVLVNIWACLRVGKPGMSIRRFPMGVVGCRPAARHSLRWEKMGACTTRSATKRCSTHAATCVLTSWRWGRTESSVSIAPPSGICASAPCMRRMAPPAAWLAIAYS